MRINLSTALPDLDGTVLMAGDKPLTMRAVLSLACLNASGPESPEFNSLEAKYNIYKMLRRINSQAEELDVKAEDVVILKKLVAKIYGVYVVGVVIDILDGVEWAREPKQLRSVSSMASDQR